MHKIVNGKRVEIEENERRKIFEEWERNEKKIELRFKIFNERKDLRKNVLDKFKTMMNLSKEELDSIKEIFI